MVDVRFVLSKYDLISLLYSYDKMDPEDKAYTTALILEWAERGKVDAIIGNFKMNSSERSIGDILLGNRREF